MLRRRNNDVAMKAAEDRDLSSCEKSIEAGKAFVELLENPASMVSPDEAEELRNGHSEARLILPPAVWRRLTPSQEAFVSRELEKHLANLLSEYMTQYRNSAEAIALREKTRQHWLRAGIDIEKHPSHIGRLRMLFQIAFPNDELLVADTFYRDGILFTARDEWFELVWNRACQRTLQASEFEEKTPKQTFQKGVALLDAALVACENDPDEAKRMKARWQASNDPKLPKPLGKATKHKQKDLFELNLLLEFISKIELKPIADRCKKGIRGKQQIVNRPSEPSRELPRREKEKPSKS